MFGFNRQRFSLFFAFLMILSLTLLVSAHSQTKNVEALAANSDLQSTEQIEEGSLANCRYGATPLEAYLTNEQVEVIPRLGAGWYLTFNPHPPLPPPENDAEFVHMIHVTQKKTDGKYLPDYDFKLGFDALNKLVANNPGDIWIIGNEVDRGPNPGEITNGKGDTFPEIYAVAYHDLYTAIKNQDPTAQVANSAMVQITPGRLQYLEKVWDTYQQKYRVPMPVDVWTMHLYVLPEVEPDGETPNGIANVALGSDPRIGKRASGGDPALCADPDVYCLAEHDDMNAFAKQVEDMRQWMKDHGQKEKPLLITEYSILYPETYAEGDPLYDEYGNTFSPSRISDFMVKSFNYLNTKADPDLGYSKDGNRLVQQWMWFSVYYPREGRTSNLVEKDYETLTLVGKTFRDYVAKENTYKNLFVDLVGNDIHTTNGFGNKVDAQISVTLRNNGNTTIDAPFEVTFYKDAARTQVIDTVTVSPPVRGCAAKPYTITVNWPDLGPGKHNYWVTVDSGNQIEETPPGNEDNTGSGEVIVLPFGLYFSMVHG